jgi:hypothetical protein
MKNVMNNLLKQLPEIKKVYSVKKIIDKKIDIGTFYQ